MKIKIITGSLLGLLFVAQNVKADMMDYGYAPWGMMGAGFGFMWLFGFIFWLLFIIALVLFIIWLMRQLQLQEPQRGKRK